MADRCTKYWSFLIKCGIPLCIFLLLLAAQQGNAQGKAIASIKPERVETGDSIALFVIVSGINTKPKSVDFAPWLAFFPPANILSKSDWRKSGEQWVQQFKLIAFDSTKMELPPLTVLLAAGKPLTTNNLSLTVFPTPGNDIDDMAPMRDIYREPVAWMDYWPWGAGALALIVFAVWYIRKMNRRPKPVQLPILETAPPVSAREIALQKIDALQKAQLWKKGQTKEHYAELSLIVREYLESTYNIAALESTTLEILPLLKKSSFPAAQMALLREILNQTDMVKYAQTQPLEPAHEAIVDKARILISPGFSKKQESPATVPIEKKPPKPHTGNYEPL